jgi:hypothetical protein
MGCRVAFAWVDLPCRWPTHCRNQFADFSSYCGRLVANYAMGSLCSKSIQARKATSGSTALQAAMNHPYAIIRVLAIILGGCVGMWMGAMSMLIVRLVRGALWITIVGHADWSSWAERYQDALFIVALIVGAVAGARFAQGYLEKDGNDSAGRWK